MGSCLACSPDEENKQNNIVSRQLEQDRRKFDSVKKILFLGSGGSGKSTIFKQLRGIYGKPFNASERRVFVSHIHEQCLTQMKLALEILEEYKNGDLDGILHKNESAYIDRYRHSHASAAEDEMSSEDEEDEDYEIPELSNEALDAAEYINNLHATFGYKLNDEIVAALKCLWQEPAIQKMYEMRNITKIVDSSAYFWDKLDSLNTPNYVPDEADILLVRYRTTGATEEKYQMPNKQGSFSIIDVGGQKSERKKWIKCFSGVTAVIFVASLSCYDEVLYEDFSTNSMTDQIGLFDDICNNEALAETSMILFLNKKDLFADKIKTVPLSKCESFESYSGSPHSFDQTTKHIRKAFTSLNNMPRRKNIFTHITCATDSDNIQKVFADVQHIVIEASLIQAGLMDWDDNDRYKADDLTPNTSNASAGMEESTQYDPEVAKEIRDSVKASNLRKEQHHLDNYHRAISTYSNMSEKRIDFRTIIKKQSFPHLDNLEYCDILSEYEYGDLVNCVNFHDKDGLLNCRYSWANSQSPFDDNENETFILFGIEPNISIQSSIKRNHLNLCFVVDVGKAMNSEFTDGQNKINLVKAAMIEIVTKKLTKNDRCAIIVFDMKAIVVHEIGLLADTNVTDLVDRINGIECETMAGFESSRVGFTGFQFAISQFRLSTTLHFLTLSKFFCVNHVTQFRKLWTQKKVSTDYENRIIMFSTSRLSATTLSESTQIANIKELGKRVCSTFIGLSNFNQFEVHRHLLSEIRGCNYFNIQSSEQMNEKIVQKFDEMVTPLMFDLNVLLKTADNKNCIDSVYRLNSQSDSISEFKYNQRSDGGNILKINSLFVCTQEMAQNDDNEIMDDFVNDSKPMILIKLDPMYAEKVNFEMIISFTNPSTSQIVQNQKSLILSKSPNDEDSFEDSEDYKDETLLNKSKRAKNKGINAGDYFDNVSIRKAILLSRYVHILRDWVLNNGKRRKSKAKKEDLNVFVSNEFESKFQQFATYFKQESKFIHNDKTLNKEISVLRSLFNNK